MCTFSIFGKVNIELNITRPGQGKALKIKVQDFKLLITVSLLESTDQNIEIWGQILRSRGASLGSSEKGGAWIYLPFVLPNVYT